jgi:hypothetical protein
MRALHAGVERRDSSFEPGLYDRIGRPDSDDHPHVEVLGAFASRRCRDR